MWGDYGNNSFSQGESNVLQDFIRTGVWNPGGKNFWFEGWVMMHSSDPLQNGAEAFLAIRCFSSTWSVQNEFRSEALTASDVVEQWMYLHSSGTCEDGTETVQAMIVLSQSDRTTDHGTVYFDDMLFGETQ